MTKKFNPNLYEGKLIWVPIPGCPGIRRRYTWNKKRQRYEDPLNGPVYEARRIESQGAERSSRTFSSLQFAREWKDRRLLEDEVPSGEPRYTVSQLVADFKAKRYPLLSETTVILYERRLGMLGPLKHLTVDALQPKDISAWLDWLRGPEQTARTTRISFEKELKTLGAVLRWHIEYNDSSTLVFPIKRKHFEASQVRRRQKRDLILSDADLQRWLGVLKASDPLFYAMAFVQVLQAFRVSEVCAMKWSNLDLTSGCYHIREHVIWPRVGGRPPRLEPGTKTRDDSYTVPLWKDVQDVLRTLQHDRSDLIFTKDGGLLHYRRVQHAYDRAFAKANLPHRGTHVCRHTGSTMFLDQTQDLLALQQLGGWKDQHMPQHYAKIRSQRAEVAMRKAEKRLHLVSSPLEKDEQIG